MAGDGRNDGTDPFEVAARREERDTRLHGAPELSPDIEIPRSRRWPRTLERWLAGTLAAIVALGSAFVIGRTLAPQPEQAEAQRLRGRSAPQDLVTDIDLAPDWTRAQHVDGHRTKKRQASRKRQTRTARRATVVVGGAPATSATIAPSRGGRSVPTGNAGRDGGKKTGHKDDKEEAAPAEPELPEPAVPLYHLYRTFKKKKPNHYFTGDATVRDAKVEEGYQFLATEGFMFGRQHRGTVPVSADNGVPGYIFEEKEPGALPLYMLRGYNGYGDIFTSDAAYRDRMVEEGWNDFGIVGYIAQT